MRCFIALEMPPAVKEHAAGLIKELKPSGADVKWVAPANLHLTLQFLGEVEPDGQSGLERALAAACAGTPLLELAVFGCGAFPGPRKPRVVWLGLTGMTAELAELAKAVQAGNQPLGFQPEARAFKAHLTLGRLRQRRGKKKAPPLGPLSRELAGLAGHRGPRFTADQAVLMQSTLTSSGPIYTPLYRASLTQGGAREDR
ncbi:MAG: RNA 2',3'-cyclic phosphodiesterase [Desulfarculaceae bacterium]|nr:RNA 2',3'-cyclic phosphodiesterase [Desulfarculaceae bacterium]MCF8071073.1 RNA 2',3'-cyclic phosphodiesterase [Desulfarculaceae bacterium]MCF8100661.1 RNA 2',3'-cyclic phosphodiesterase [Desulfarculaceae bacterium]MCF8116905.1 RNA 2',3'-cyclic phosphodiesterase [Desulfarculaceae bacterium]